MNGSGFKRGAFIVFEGCDKSGKTTQCRRLVDKLWENGVTAQFLCFPDRSTATGRIIDNYLAKKEELPDQAIHLLFSANRWESVPKLKELLLKGVTLVVDRYSYSGVAYSAAKPGMDLEWCKQPEQGLPKPDIVFLMNATTDAITSRSGFGDERYEANEFQTTVFKNFLKLKDASWKIIESNRDIDTIHQDLLSQTQDVIESCQTKELQSLW